MPRQSSSVKQNSEYTFKYNMSLGRHGWLRLTPAYSVRLVEEILKTCKNKDLVVFDPFSGTGTTGLVAASYGHNVVLNDINPFLVWLANQKSRNYTEIERKRIYCAFRNIVKSIDNYIKKDNWVPDIFKIHRWWNKETLHILSAVRSSIVDIIGEPEMCNGYGLVWVAFCRIIIDTSSAAFNHVSMSFNNKTIEYEKEQILSLFFNIMDFIIESTKDTITGHVSVINNDSRLLNGVENIDLVITSPPYPNRISYIRELRPYMYWLKYIEKTTDSSDIDWDSIGGTWGSATSKLLSWNPQLNIDFMALQETIEKIAKTNEKNSRLMSIYVHKYFYDMYIHINKMYNLLNDNAEVYYIVGNSTFFNVDVDSDLFYREMFKRVGFNHINSQVIRKRNCNKKLYEYCIMASKNSTAASGKTVYALPDSQAWLPFDS